MFSLPSLIFTISSLITLALIYFHVPIKLLQQFSAVLIIILLIITSRFISHRSQKIWYFLSLWISSFFVQILILATGGLYSSFLILIHLFTLGSGFLLSLSSSLIFLFFTLSILMANIYLNPQMMAIFRDDPGSAILYFISFIVIIPLAQYLIYSYHLKNKLFKALQEYAETGEQRERSVFNNINELVVVTDQNLKILSTNEAIERSLSLTPESYIDKPILESIPLKDQNNAPLTPGELSINQILADKVTRIIDGFLYQAPSDPKPRPVAIQIRPLTNSEGEINQIVFLITDPQKNANQQRHADLQETHTKQKLIIQELKQALLQTGRKEMLTKLELYHKNENDLFLAYELEDHPISPIRNPEDIAAIGKQTVTTKQNLADILGVKLQFILPGEEIAETSLLGLRETNIKPQALQVSSFLAPVDKQWFTIALQKLIDIGLLLASEKPNQQIELLVKHDNQNSQTINLVISIPYHQISDNEIQELFTENYSNLALISNLRLGSGLEGFIAKNILDQINIPFSTTFDPNQNSLSFSFNLNQTLSEKT